MRANHTPHLRAVRMRRIRRRFYLSDGVVRVRFIKVLPPPYDGPVGAALPRPDLPPDYAKCIGCFGYFTRGFKAGDGQGMCIECLARLQSPVGAALPEPDPKPTTEYKHLYCEDCGKSICYVPLNDYAGALYFCKSCQRNVHTIEDVAPLSPAEQKEAESADNWAKGLSMGGITPPWPGGAA